MRECECGYVLVASDEPEPMGDTLAHYARPLLERFPGDLSFEEFKAVIDFAAFLWNLAAVEDIPKAVAHLSTKMPPRLRIEAPKGLAVVRRMLTRRSTEFASDARLALKVDVHLEGTRMLVKALGVCFEPDPAAADSPSRPGDETGSRTRNRLH